VIRLVGFVAFGFLLQAQTGLDLVMAEPNLEKRSEKALQHAGKVLTAAWASYKAGDAKGSKTGLEEVRESVELAMKSLQESGKNPRKSPKYFKRAELKTRELVRRLDSFSHDAALDDRPPIDKLKARIQEIHDELLQGIMGKRK
jgi:hypothetical protein